MKIEIPKEPEVPPLNDEAVNLLTKLCFGANEKIEQADAVLIFGTSNLFCLEMLSQNLRDIVTRTGVKRVFITGGYFGSNLLAESQVAMDFISSKPWSKSLLSGIDFTLEIKSHNSLGNVKEAMMLGLSRYSRIVFIAKVNHCGRCLLTLRGYLIQAIIQQSGYVYSLEDIPGVMEPCFWFKEPRLTSLVWGEFLRIEHYGKRGDIAYPPEIRDKVKRIRELTAGK